MTDDAGRLADLFEAATSDQVGVPDAAATGLQAAHLTNPWGWAKDCQITAVRLSFCNLTGRAAVASDRLTMVPTQSRHDDVPASSRRTGS